MYKKSFLTENGKKDLYYCIFKMCDLAVEMSILSQNSIKDSFDYNMYFIKEIVFMVAEELDELRQKKYINLKEEEYKKIFKDVKEKMIKEDVLKQYKEHLKDVIKMEIEERKKIYGK